MSLDCLHLSLISNGKQTLNAKVWTGLIKLNKTGQPYFPISLFMAFFQTRRAGEGVLEQGSLSILRSYRHRAVTVWSGSSCELFLLENLVRPMEEKTEPELKPGLSTFFSVVWQEQGRSVSSVRGQGPGASRPLPVHSWFSFPWASAVSEISWLTPPKRPFFTHRSFLLQAMVL